MDNLKVFAKRLGTNEKLTGTGINIFDGNAILYNKYASYEVDPETIVLRSKNEMENYENPTMDNHLTYKLHEKLMQTVIDFLVENNITDVDEISFGADSLQVSKGYRKWTPATDSSLTLIGYQDGKRKKINNSI